MNPSNSRWIERLIDERTIIAVIVVNSLAIFLRSFPSLPAAYDFFLFGIDYGCTLYFLVEVSIKLRVLGPRAFLRGPWNWFDFAVVLVSLPTLLTPFLELHDFSGVLILRLGRLARSFRLLRFIPDGERLWAGVRRGMRASVGVVMALGLYNFVLGLGACYLFAEQAPGLFGDPLSAMYSMFRVFTTDGWVEIPEAVSSGLGPWSVTWVRGFFVFAVSTGGLLGLSMANAVFVDEMVLDNNDALQADIDMLKQEVLALRLQNRADVEAMDRKLDRLLAAVPPIPIAQAPTTSDAPEGETAG